MTTALLWMAFLPSLLLGTTLNWLKRLALLLMLCMGARAGVMTYGWHAANSYDSAAIQRDFVATAKSLFPDPIPYIDRCGMISSYPKVGLFMSSLMMERYRAVGKPVFETILRERQPPMLIANSMDLDLRRSGREIEPQGAQPLLAADFDILKANFVNHWGPIWVAGKEFEVEPDRANDVHILISGIYTLEADQAVQVDDSTILNPGRFMHLGQGTHRVRSQRAGPVRLRIGTSLARPSHPPPFGTLIEGFSFNRPELPDVLSALFAY
jgi:hypothetical protein